MYVFGSDFFFLNFFFLLLKLRLFFEYIYFFAAILHLGNEKGRVCKNRRLFLKKDNLVYRTRLTEQKYGMFGSVFFFILLEE